MKRQMISVVLLILLSSCSFQTEKENQTEDANKIQGTSENQVSFTLGLFDETATSQLNITHEINNNDNYTPKIVIHNRNSYEDNYRILVLLDYKQIEYQSKGETVEFLDINAKPNEQINLDISIPSIKPGLHDLLIVCIREPNKSLAKEAFIPPEVFYLSKRTNLLVGANEKHEFKVSPLNTSKGEPIPPILTTEPRGELEGKIITQINKEEVPSELWLNFYGEKEKSYYILSFLDSKQLEISKEIYSPTNDGILNIPIDSSRLDKGNLTMMVVENPYSKMETSDGQVKPWSVDFVNKITIY